MAFNNSNGVSANNSTFNEVHHGGTQINGPQINHFSGSSSLFEIFCKRRVAGAAFNSSERHSAPKCLPNTRVDVRSKIGQWFSGFHDHPICWLRGPAGSGKSAIAQSIAEGCDQHGELAASFFFDRKNAGRSDITDFIPTIAYQLAISVPSTKILMQSALQLDPSISDQTRQHQFKKLIVDPFLTLKGLISPKVIVVDALDQCDGEGHVEELLTLLTDACQNDWFPLRFCLTSRAEDYIESLFEDYKIRCKVYSLALEEFDARDDIRTFFKVRLSMIYTRNWRRMPDVPIPWPSRSELDQLVVKSSGIFIFASTILKFINDGNDLPHRKLQTALKINIVLDGDNCIVTAASRQEHPGCKPSVEHLAGQMMGTSSLQSCHTPEEIIPDQAPIETGRYTITNVRFKNLAALPDSNVDTEIVAQLDLDEPGEKWNITLFNNARYTLRSHSHINFANCGACAKAGDNVFGQEHKQQWIIRETSVKGHYTISPTYSPLFWGLADGEMDTPVTLANNSNNTKNQWFFTKCSG